LRLGAGLMSSDCLFPGLQQSAALAMAATALGDLESRMIILHASIAAVFALVRRASAQIICAEPSGGCFRQVILFLVVSFSIPYWHAGY
jgi:hypothetical protein